MNSEAIVTPISPPTSPRMSGYPATGKETDWQHQQSTSAGPTSFVSHDNNHMLRYEAPTLSLNTQDRPTLRSYRSFPHTLHKQISSTQDHPAISQPPASAGLVNERITISNVDDISNAALPAITYGGSAPASPVSGLSPPSPVVDVANQQPEANDELFEDEDEEQGEGDSKKPMTAAELRAQKRKMKRFRLTHNQTRFLMSEFARQAHPDAAHRERLSREIPGLSPRQVQVWFQNRRAKLKRLTSDDRERMMRSRALPEDFDMTQALHSPFGAHPNTVATPMASPSAYSTGYPDRGMARPLSIDTLRRAPEVSHMSPTGITPSFGGFEFTPPQSATTNYSPISGSPDSSAFGFPSISSVGSSPRRTQHPFAPAPHGASSYSPHAPVPRLHLHERIGRNRAESLSSPLRSSITYNNLVNESPFTESNNEAVQAIDNSQLAGEPSNPQRGAAPPMAPYGLGYPYNQVTGFQASASNRMRSFSGGVPRRIELSSHYEPPRNMSHTPPQTAGFPTYQHTPLSATFTFQMSAPHHVTTFPNSYLRQDTSQGEHYPQIGAVLGEVVDQNGQENNAGNHHSNHQGQHDMPHQNY